MNERTRISQVVKEARRIAILSHQNPDGDAIGSTLAAYFVFQTAGKEAIPFNPDPVPSDLAFLPGSGEIRSVLPLDLSFDLFLVLDCGSMERMGDLRQAVQGLVINIDHHRSNGRFGGLNWVEEEASSTGEMVYRLLLEEMGLPLPREAAICLYTAILTDTGCFRFPNTTAESLRIAGQLVRAGACPERIAAHLYEQRGLGQLRVLGEMLTGLQVSSDGRIAWGVITQEMIQRGQIAIQDTEGFVNYPRSLRGVEVALLFKEVALNRYRVSLRSKGNIDVEKVASAFGGGGHPNAAGCTVQGNLEEVKTSVLEEIRRWIVA
jgi:phosphoesterase RecJ-like protein